MHEFNFSFIIPHKNIPHLLHRCISSIPKRSDIQIIIIDDNSDNTIVDFQNFPGKHWNNVDVIFTKENLGAGYARNKGLDIAKGKWILFADADDFFTDNLVQILNYTLTSETDLIVFDTNSVDSDTLIPMSNREDTVRIYKKTNDENILRFVHHTVWGKVFKHEIIRKFNIKCDEVKASNDVMFACYAGYYAYEVKYLPIIGYCCTHRRGSICTKISFENVLARIFVVQKCNRFLENKNVKKRYWMNQLGPLFNCLSLNKQAFMKYFSIYIQHTPFSRLCLDIYESSSRYIKRLLRINEDKDFRTLQKKFNE